MAFSNTTPQPTKAAANSGPILEPRPLDILFLQDATGSQGPYISSARSAIQDICEKISINTSLCKGSIRFGLIAFRDHPPQDTSFVTKNFGFTNDVARMTQNLAYLTACGGGDGPEAQTAALAEALDMDWAEDAVKIVVLITDAPPHGLGEDHDGFNKSPDQNDPLDIVRQMAEHGITIYVIACEPTLSQYKHAVDFYRAICQICRGRMIPLLNASQLGDYIVGSAVETVETEKLIGEFQSVILEDVYGQGKPIEEVMKDVQAQLSKRNVQVQTLNVEDVYEPSAEADHNTHVWASSETVPSARCRIVLVPGPRLKSEYVEYDSNSETSYEAFDEGIPSFYGTTTLGLERPAVSEFFSCEAPSSRPNPPSAAPPSVQPVSMTTQAVDRVQAERIVMQSLMRGSKVGPGNVFIPIGEYASKPSTSYAPIFSSESAIAEVAVAEEVYPAEEEAILEVYERGYMVEGVCTASEAVHWQEVEVTDNVAEFVYAAAEEATEEVDIAERVYTAAGEVTDEAYETDYIAEVVYTAAEGATEEVDVYEAEEAAEEAYETDYIAEVVNTAAEDSEATDEVDVYAAEEATEKAYEIDYIAEVVETAAEEATEEVDVYAAEEATEKAYEIDYIAEVVETAAEEATEEVDVYAAEEATDSEEAHETECIVEVASTAAEEVVQEVNDTDGVEEVFTAAETIQEAYDADNIADRVDFAAEGVVPANGVRREREEPFVYEALPERRFTPAPTAASSVQAVSTPA